MIVGQVVGTDSRITTQSRNRFYEAGVDVKKNFE
jgi:hypothetical protein